MPMMPRLVHLRTKPLIGRLIQEFLLLYGLEIPVQVKIGRDFTLHHRGMGTVIHPLTTIGNNVTMYHQVTIGRADAHIPYDLSQMTGIVIEDNVTIFPGAKILGREGVTTIGAGAVIAANAVVTRSVPAGETWAGVPARSLGGIREGA